MTRDNRKPKPAPGGFRRVGGVHPNYQGSPWQTNARDIQRVAPQMITPRRAASTAAVINEQRYPNQTGTSPRKGILTPTKIRRRLLHSHFRALQNGTRRGRHDPEYLLTVDGKPPSRSIYTRKIIPPGVRAVLDHHHADPHGPVRGFATYSENKKESIALDAHNLRHKAPHEVSDAERWAFCRALSASIPGSTPSMVYAAHYTGQFYDALDELYRAEAVANGTVPRPPPQHPARASGPGPRPAPITVTVPIPAPSASSWARPLWRMASWVCGIDLLGCPRP